MGLWCRGITFAWHAKGHGFNSRQIHILYYMILYILWLSYQCVVNGGKFNDCLLKENLKENISFCYNYISDYLCVPQSQYLWDTWSILKKDQEIEKQVVLILELRLEKEKGKSPNATTKFLSNSYLCYKNFVKFICNSNFP